MLFVDTSFARGLLFVGVVAVSCAASRSLIAENRESDSRSRRRVFVPVEDLDVVLKKDRKGVLLPHEDYEKLVEQARQNKKRSPHQPAELVVSHVEYQARISGERLLVTARVEFTQFSDDWQIIPLPLRALSVERATVNDVPARLGRAQQAPHNLQFFHNQTGRATLQLELSTPLISVGSDKTAEFGLIPSPASTLEITVPAQKHLLVDGLAAARPTSIEQPAIYQVALGGRKEVRLQFTDRTTQQQSDALVFAATGFGLAVTPGEVTWQAATSLQVSGQRLDRLMFSVPDYLEIVDVDSTGLESWELSDASSNPPPPGNNGANRTLISLQFRQPFDGARRITFQGVMSTQPGRPWSVPNLILKNSTSHVGRVLVRFPQGVRLHVAETNGVRPAISDGNPSQNEVGEAAIVASRFPQVLNFDVWREDFDLSFLTQSKQREIQAAVSTILEVTPTELDLQWAATIETLFAPLFDLDLALPADWTITSVQKSGRPILWSLVPRQAGLHQVRISFDPPLQPGAEVQLTLQARRALETGPIDHEPFQVNLPELRLPQADVVEGTLIIKADDDFDITPVDVVGLDPASLNLQGERLGYRFQDTRFSGQLQILRKTARLTARTQTWTRLESDLLRSHVLTELIVTRGRIRGVRLRLPESVGQDVRFQLVANRSAVPDGLPRIVEQTVSGPETGELIWTLLFDRWIKGTVGLGIQVQIPRGDADEFRTPHLRVLSAERQYGFIALSAEDDQRLSVNAVDAHGHPLKEIDPFDLTRPSSLADSRIVAAFQYDVPGYQVAFTEYRFDKQGLPRAFCHLAQFDTVLAQTGELHHQAVFLFVAIGVQSLQIQLPDDETTELWATLIDGIPVEVRRTPAGFLVPVSPAAQPEDVRTLKLLYRTNIGRLSPFGRLEQQLPRISAIMGGGLEQSLEILDKKWTLHYPRDLLLTESTGHFAPVTELTVDSLLGRLRQSLRAPSREKLSVGGISVAIALGVVAVCALLYHTVRRLNRRALLVLILAAILLPVVLYYVSIQESHYETFQRTANPLNGDSAASVHTRRGLSESASSRVSTNRDDRSTEGLDVDFDFNVTDSETAQSKRMLQMMPLKTDDGATEDTSQDDAKNERFGRPLTGLDADAVRGGRGLGGGLGGGGGGLGGGGGGLQNQLAQAEQPQAAAPAEAPDAPGKAGGETFFGKTQRQGGLLSLDLRLEAPQGSLRREFRSLSVDDSSGDAGLVLRYENRRGQVAVRIFAVTAVLLVFWMMRNQSARSRAMIGVMFITGPLALSTVVPAGLHTLLDGLFLGSLGGILLWGMRFVLNAMADEIQNSPSHNKSRTLLMFGVVSLGIAAAALAQDQIRVNTKPTETQSESPLETVIVPYRSGSDPLAAQRVLLPYDKFRELWNQAHPEQRIKTPAPVDGFVAEALYTAEPNPSATQHNASLSIKTRYVVYSFRDRQVTLAIPLRHVALQQALLDGKTAPLLSLADPTAASQGNQNQSAYAVIVEEPGLHVLDLQFEVSVQRTGPAGSFTLPLLPVATGSLTVALPDNGLQIRVNGSSNAYHRFARGEQSFVKIPIEHGGDLRVSWQPAQEQAVSDRIVHADGATAVTVDDAGLHLSTGYVIRVPQGSLSEIAFALPASLQLRQIRSRDVAGWEFREQGESRTLHVIFRREIKDEVQVTIDLFQPLLVGRETATLAFPHFAVQNVTRETGLIAVFAGPQFSMQSQSASGLTRLKTDKFQTPAKLRRPPQAPQLVYRYNAKPIQLEWSLARRRPESRVFAEHDLAVGQRKLAVSSRLRFELTELPRAKLAIRLPPGFLLLDVSAKELADWHVTSQNDPRSRLLIVDLASPRSGQVTVLLKGTFSRQPDEPTVALDIPRPVDVQRTETHLAARLDPGYSATLAEIGGWKSLDPDQLTAVLRPTADRPVQFAFHSAETTLEPVVLKLSRGTPRLTAESLSVVTVADDSISLVWGLKWQIAQAAADTFVFASSASLAGKLDFQGAAVRQVTETPAGEGRVRWTVVLQNPVRDEYFLTATALLPPPAVGEDETTAQITIPTIEFENFSPAADSVPLETQQQVLLMVNESQGELIPTNPESWETVQRAELQQQVRQGIVVREDMLNRATTIARIKQVDVAPTFELRRLEQQRGAAASINLADLTTVLARDGSWRTQAVYRIQNVTRQFLALRMPADTRILSVFVGGKPGRPVHTQRKGRLAHLVALPTTGIGSGAFEVRLILAGKLEGLSLSDGLDVWGTSVDLPAPQVLSPQDDAEFGMPVARTLWTVYLPSDVDAQPVRNSERTNLRRLPADRLPLFEASTLLPELSGAISILEGRYDPNEKLRALEQAQQLEQALRSNTAVTMPSDDKDITRSQQEFERLQRKLSRNQAQKGEVSSQRQSDSGRVADEQARRSQLGKQSENLVTDNSIRAKDAEFLFGDGSVQFLSDDIDLDTFRRADEGETAAAPGKEPSSKRGRRREQSLAQTAQLNRQQEDKKQVDQIQIQPRQAARELRAGEGALFEEAPAERIPSLVPSRAGGLSLDLSLPTDGHALSFTKIGGGPQLALTIRPWQSQSIAAGLIWFLAWLVVGGGMLVAINRADGSDLVFRILPGALIVLGLAGFFLIPGSIAWVGLALFVIGSVVSVWRRLGAPGT